VRSGYGVNYPVTSVIRLGNKVTMYEKSNGFYKISYGGKIGYISELYVKATGSSATNTNTTTTVNSTSTVTTPVLQSTGVGTVTASSLNVRKSACMSSSIYRCI